MNETELLISVIVPVYNTELFLPKCLDSIVGQTYRNLQIILVDDGSPDRCGEICDEYARKDERIEVIHQPNSGVVTARNAGLNLAKGEYLAFVDSDDWIELDMYEKLIVLASAPPFPDMVFCRVLEEYGNGQRIVSKELVCYDYEVLIGHLWSDTMFGGLYFVLIKKLFYDCSNIETDPDCCINEDRYIILQLLYNRPALDYVDSPLYHYNKQNELSCTKKSDVLIASVQNMIHMYDFLIDKGLFDSYKNIFNCWCIKIKIAILKEEGIEAARKVCPLTHRSLIAFRPMNRLIAVFYWFGFNGGLLGKFFITSYLKFRSLKKQYSK